MQTDNSIYIEPIGFEGTKGNWEQVLLGSLIDDSNYIPYHELCANCLLLEQSKELLKALQGLVNDVENKPNDTRYATHLKIAKEVINKALNQQ